MGRQCSRNIRRRRQPSDVVSSRVAARKPSSRFGSVAHRLQSGVGRPGRGFPTVAVAKGQFYTPTRDYLVPVGAHSPMGAGSGNYSVNNRYRIRQAMPNTHKNPSAASWLDSRWCRFIASSPTACVVLIGQLSDASRPGSGRLRAPSHADEPIAGHADLNPARHRSRLPRPLERVRGGVHRGVQKKLRPAKWGGCSYNAQAAPPARQSVVPSRVCRRPPLRFPQSARPIRTARPLPRSGTTCRDVECIRCRVAALRLDWIGKGRTPIARRGACAGSGRCAQRRRHRADASRQPSPPVNPLALRLRPVTREEGQEKTVPRYRGDLPERDRCNLKKVCNLRLKSTHAARRTSVSNSGAAMVVDGLVMPTSRPPRSGAPPGGDCAPVALVKTNLPPRFRFAPNWQTRTLKSNDRLSLPGLFHL